MEPLAIALIVTGILTSFLGGILMLVAAFRQSVGWGLASLLVPFASLIFVIVHWAAARKSFVISLLGGALIAAGIFSSPTVRGLVAQARSLDPAKLELDPAKMQLLAANLQQPEAAKPAPDLSTEIQRQRERLEQLEAKFAHDGEALVQEFAALTKRRNALKTDDAAAVAGFNTAAATYQAHNTARRQAKAEIDALRLQIETLLDQRARIGAPATASPAGSKRVVMFTTATCPACLMAKAYFAKKGVAFEERDVNRTPAAREEFQRLGGRGVPLILVGNERMEGFNAQRLDQLL